MDEYQDTNASQYLLVKLLVGMRNQFTVVGDDDQSIYAWRARARRTSCLLKEDYPSLKVVMLEQELPLHQPHPPNCANILIANNPHVFETAVVGDGPRRPDPRDPHAQRGRRMQARGAGDPHRAPAHRAPITATSPSSTAATTRPS